MVVGRVKKTCWWCQRKVVKDGGWVAMDELGEDDMEELVEVYRCPKCGRSYTVVAPPKD